MTTSVTTASMVAALTLLMSAAVGTLPARADILDCYSPQCQAPIPGQSIADPSSETAGFVGLRWNFGSQVPAVTVGIRFTRTGVDDDVTGAKMDFSLDLKKDFAFTPTVRLLGIVGNRDVQGELGLGIQTADWQALLSGGVQLAHFNLGANLTLDGTLAPFVELNGLGRPLPPLLIEGELTCAVDGMLLQPVDGDTFEGPIEYYTPGPGLIVDGYTCFDPS